MKKGMWRTMLLPAGLGLALCGCSARPGMFCLADSDCRTGLICVRPPADAAPGDGGTFGICEDARHGVGEVCLWSSECQPSLVCSNLLGEFTGDGRHGRCVATPGDASDGGAEADQAVVVDGGGDGGADLGPADAMSGG
jgi:hypothetical protein